MVNFGFSIVILIMILLAVVWLTEIKDTNAKVLELIEEHDTKIELAYTMRSVVTRRYNLLLSMLIIDDPFEVDETVSEFYAAAYEYRSARKALHALPMDKEESILHKELDRVSALPQDENIQAAEMFRADAPKREIEKVIRSARSNQDNLLSMLDLFVKMQKGKDDAVVKYSHDIVQSSIYWISFFGIIGFIISIFISRYVGKAVALKNQQLMDSGSKMEKAYLHAEEATEAKSEFLATMSHEIRTPLTAIIGFAETTLYGEQTKEQRLNSIRTIIRSGKHLLHTINDILDLSKVEANKLEIEYAYTSLTELIEDIEGLQRPNAEDKLLTFTVNYTYPLPEKIKVDELRIKQVLLNLCSNAIKFTESGYVEINIKCQGEKAILFSVSDSGIGISKEQQKIIFKAYHQADSSTTRRFGGTGLGLSLSKLLVERMGGTLSVNSDEGKGSQFDFWLPCEKTDNIKMLLSADNKVKEKPKSIEELATNNLSGHVLLAEDNVDNQDLFSIYLNRIGVEVSIVENGLLAVEAVEKNDFDLILMDMRMPVMGGLEAIEIIRKNGFEIPIVAVTANAMQEDKDNCYAVGCNDFLTKPIDSSKLIQTLGKYLDIKVNKNPEKVPLLSSLLETDPNMINLVKRFVNSYPELVDNIKDFIVTSDYEELSDALHKLKGTSGNIGFEKVSTTAEKMEFQLLAKNHSELAKLYKELKGLHQQMLLGIKDL